MTVEMRSYRKKPHKVRAFKLTEENFEQVCTMQGFSRHTSASLWVPTLPGGEVAHIGDWIVGHPDAESYPYFTAMGKREFNIRYEDDE